MRAVDTNVLLRLLTGDDPRQTRAAEEFVAPGVWVPLLVLAEAIWVLESVYDRDARAQMHTIDALLKHKDLTVQDADVATAALASFRRRPALGFSDCLVLELARKAGHLPMGTFDRDLAKLDWAQRL